MVKEKVPGVVNSLIRDTEGVMVLTGVSGFEDIAFNIEIPHRFIVTKEKMVFAFNGTTYNNNGLQIIPQIPSVDIQDTSKTVNNSVQLYVNEYFLDSFANTFFSASSLEATVLKKGMNKKAKAKMQEVIYKYFPGVWVYFMGSDFDIIFELTIQGCDTIRSSALGYTSFTGATGLTTIYLKNDDDELILEFKPLNTSVNMTFDFYNEDDKHKTLRILTQMYDMEVGAVLVMDSYFGDF
jgi:hypothetical protein